MSGFVERLEVPEGWLDRQIEAARAVLDGARKMKAENEALRADVAAQQDELGTLSARYDDALKRINDLTAELEALRCSLKEKT